MALSHRLLRFIGQRLIRQSRGTLADIGKRRDTKIFPKRDQPPIPQTTEEDGKKGEKRVNLGVGQPLGQLLPSCLLPGGSRSLETA